MCVFLSNLVLNTSVYKLNIIMVHMLKLCSSDLYEIKKKLSQNVSYTFNKHGIII